MGSRRRPSQRFHVEELSRGQTPEDPHDLQLMPTVKKGTKSHGIEDCLGHQKWYMKRQPAIHPALTDFGPQSLHAFIENELASLRERAMRAVTNTQQDQDQQLRQFALDLVNAQSNIYLTKENGQRTFKVSKMRGNTRRSQEHNSTSEKGKAAVRNISQSDSATMPGSWTQVNDTAAFPAARNPKKSTSDSLSKGYPGSRSVNDSGKSKPPGSKPIRTGGFDGLPQSANAKNNAVQPLRRSSRTTASKKAIPGQAALSKGDLDGDIRMLDGALSGQDGSAATALEQLKAEAPGPVSKSKVLLTRTTSFENHASSSRISLRSRGKSLTSGSQLPGDSHRRRKTPATINSDDPIEATPGWRPLVLPQEDSPFEASANSFLDPTAGSRIENGVGLSPSKSPSLASSQHYGEQSFTRRHSVPRNVSGGDSQRCFTVAGSECEEMENGATAVKDVSPEDFEEQHAILESIDKNQSQQRKIQAARSAERPARFDYGLIVPETMPLDVRQAEVNRCKIWQAHGFDGHGKLVSPQDDSQHSGPFTSAQLDPEQKNFLSAPNSLGDYPRKFIRPLSPGNPREPPFCPPVWPKTSLPIEFWEAGVLQYLSSAEVRSLRLVCRSLAQDLEPYVFRSVVAKFDPSLFSLYPSFNQDGKLDLNPDDSMLKRHGPTMNKFGITFDFDSYGLMHAPFKNTEKAVDAWFGKYKWPITDYPYFPALKKTDKLLDDERRLLTQAMSNLGKCSELAISVDSGHGWLEGPDTSDLALYRNKMEGGAKIFGKTFSAIDRNYEDGMKQLFAWAQINTINESIKYLDSNSSKVREELETLRRMIIREYDSYREEKVQPDYNKYLHTGGLATANNSAQIQNPAAGNVAHPLVQQINQLTQQMGAAPSPQNPNNHYLQQRFASVMDLVRNHLPSSDTQSKNAEQKREGIQPQWPVIFNGLNLSAESRGDTNYIQSRVAAPSDFPLLPNSLTEAQAQWIMETSWIQRTFLSAYTDAVRVSSSVLKNVHSLHIAKLSSGLLPALSQKAFWAALPGLRKVTIIIKPDWRVEHIPGDKYFQSTMATDPVCAAYKFAELLRDFITRLENLNCLHIGYVGGGEHQTGMFGRNQHILPAPITSNPRDWLIAQNPSMAKPNGNTMFTFPHIRTLTFENCWFSPYMLETFMRMSRDTSLHNLVLDSVSLTAQVNSTRTDGPLRTIENGLKCQHAPSAWLNEVVPANASWVNTLDKITPGNTILDRKYDAGMINEEETPRPEKQFRGNIQQITLNSCGYVKILGIPSNEFNQNELVFQNTSWSALDEGLKVRSCQFTKTVLHEAPSRPADDDQPDGAVRFRRRRTSTSAPGSWTAGLSSSRPDGPQHREPQTTSITSSRFIMLAGRHGHVRGENVSHADNGGGSTALTGFLTQCVHPVEKRILERKWGMKFGWGDDMKRWEAVEDGWFIGGTGRFSGDVFQNPEQQEAVAIPIEEEVEDEPINTRQSASSNTRPNARNLGLDNMTMGTSFATEYGAGPSGTQGQDAGVVEGEDSENENDMVLSGNQEDDAVSEDEGDFFDTEVFPRTTRG